MAAAVLARKGTEKEQMLFRRMLHERGFKLTSFDETCISYDEDGVARFQYPDSFWMKEDEILDLRLEFYLRKQRAA